MSRQTHEDSVVRGELIRWGYWLGVQHAAEGYSPTNTLARLMSGRSAVGGHKILCVDPPERSRFWEINRNVLQLERELYEVLLSRYALPYKDELTRERYRMTELAVFLGITPERYLTLLARAHARYRGLIFPTPFVRNLALAMAAC